MKSFAFILRENFINLEFYEKSQHFSTMVTNGSEDNLGKYDGGEPVPSHVPLGI